MCESSRLEVLDINHNSVTELPIRLMSSGSLRKLLAGWNEVCQLAERMERSQLEVLDLQHNHLTELPHNLFIKAQRCALLFFFFSYLFFPYAFHLVFFHVCFHLSIYIYFLSLPIGQFYFLSSHLFKC